MFITEFYAGVLAILFFALSILNQLNGITKRHLNARALFAKSAPL